MKIEKIFPQEFEQTICEKYLEGASKTEIGRQYDLPRWRVAKILKRYNIDTRPVGIEAFSERDKDKIIERCKRGENKSSLSRELRCIVYTIEAILRERDFDYSLYTKERHRFRRDRPINTKNKGRCDVSGGYIKVRVSPYHPWAKDMAMDRKRNIDGKRTNYILEHRLVMAEFLGRPLSEHETVHHLDGNRSNNDISNLQLRSSKHGQGVKHICLDCGSHDIEYLPLDNS